MLSRIRNIVQRDKVNDQQYDSKACKEDFQIKCPLGYGQYGQVVLVTHVQTGKQYAMKIVEKAAILDNGRIQDLFSERSVLKRSSHPFIVKLHYSFQSETRLFFVMEYKEGGDLKRYIDRTDEGLVSSELAKTYLAEVILALQYLHSNGIVYRDLKPENILLDSQGHASLADFGLAKDFQMEDALEARCTSFVGSPFYVAPEVLRREPYTQAVDLWACGVLLFYMITGSCPFRGDTAHEIFRSILKKAPDFKSYSWISNTEQDIITGLLQKQESTRLTSADAKAHPYFCDMDWDGLMTKKCPPPDYLPGISRSMPMPVIKGPIEDICRSPDLTIGTVQQQLFEGFSYIAPDDEMSLCEPHTPTSITGLDTASPYSGPSSPVSFPCSPVDGKYYPTPELEWSPALRPACSPVWNIQSDPCGLTAQRCPLRVPNFDV